MKPDDEVQVGTTTHERLLVSAEVAAHLLSISKASFYAMKAASRLPAPVHFGRMVRWNVEELRQWVNCGCPAWWQWKELRHEFGFREANEVAANRQRVRRRARGREATDEPKTTVQAADHTTGPS